MSNFPYLDQMRTEREQVEASSVQPYKTEIVQSGIMIRSLREKIDAFQSALGDAIGSELIQRVTDEVAHEIRSYIYKAIEKAGINDDQVLHLDLPASLLKFTDPQSLERTVLDRFAQSLHRGLRLDVRLKPDDCTTIVTVTMQGLAVRYTRATRAMQ